MRTLDAHIHFAGDHTDCVAMLEELDIKTLNICIAYGPGSWKDQKETCRVMGRTWPARYAWCTSFDPPDFPDTRYAERIIAEIDQDFAAEASACKVWKNIGLEFKTPSNEYLMVDDPILSPIFAHLQKSGHPEWQRRRPGLQGAGCPWRWSVRVDGRADHAEERGLLVRNRLRRARPGRAGRGT